MIDNSCYTLEELSVKYWGKFKFVGGPEYIAFKTGYNSIIKFIEHGLKLENILVNSAVESIQWKRDINTADSCSPVVLTLADKNKILADCVIITCSLGYLKENHEKMFDPPLPKTHKLTIDNLGFGLINKIFLDFGESWWKADSKGFQFLWSQEDSNALPAKSLATWTRDLTGFDVLQDRQGVLLGWIGGQGAYIIETLSEQEIARDCVNLLKYYLKLDQVPAVKKCMRTQWNANKYIRGSYSHISVNCDKLGVTPSNLAQPIWANDIRQDYVKEIPIIMFAGEATHENFYSTTHGAYDTGVNQAQIFLQHHLDLRKS